MTTRLKEFRTSLGLTQLELARAVGVRRETIVFLERGRYNPSLRLAVSVAGVLQTTVDELFSFEDEISETGVPTSSTDP